MQPEITDASEVEVRQEVVTLKGLRTAGGQGVKVLVLPVDALDLARITKVWKGLVPQVGPQESAGEGDNEAGIRDIARPLIEASVHVMRDGRIVKAFSWSGDSVLPPNQLTVEDINALMESATRLSGLGPEGEQGAGFPDGQPRGLGDGGGTDVPEPEFGPDAVAGM